MDWDKLRIFHSVADVGSLTHAGDVLHLSQSAVSRQIRALEEKLNVTLFHRHARGLILTEQGELLYEATSQMSKRLETAEARIRDSEDEVFGELRVTTTTGFGTLWLAPRINRLYEQYPDLNIDLRKSFLIGDRTVDIKTALNAGITSIGVKSGYGCRDNEYDIKPNYFADNLKDAIDIIRGLENKW